MIKARLASALGQLCGAIVRHSDGGLSDAQLFERFASQQDQAAFEVLVWRHGPMVFRVGQRVLHNVHDAEDVLQATFLALVRQARSIRRGDTLASWLYQVAYRTAQRARQRRARYSTCHVVEELLSATTSRDDAEPDALSALDEELHRLPRRYQIPLILSYLQGLTNREIAVQLGCPMGTVLRAWLADGTCCASA